MSFFDMVEINPRVKIEKAKEYPFVEMGVVEPGSRYVRADHHRIFKNGGAKFLPGDILFARITPCLENGKIAQYQGTQGQAAFGSTEFFVFRARPKISDSAFIYYLAKSDIIRKPAEKSMSGASGRQRADLKSIVDLQVPCPPLPTQRKIAAILSAYDDLIENNLRRIKILEEMAQNLYREWFVKFRFPGHQNARFVDSPLGRIPEGWEVKTMPNAVILRPPLPVPKNKQIPFVSMGSLANDSMLISEIEYRSKASGARFQNGDTLFARITPCLENGKTGFVQFLQTDDIVACGSTEFIVLRSRTLCPEYVYLMARSDSFRDNAIKSMSGATGRQRVREECFDQFFLAQPTDEILMRFQEYIRPKFKMIQSLNHRNQVLRRTRDLLLPKLISGAVDVSELDISVPEAAA
ncbi:MAG: restriction endonuclease subunit S [Desulfobacteraceae bacterium]|nr:MAG: restriction endonuclease subunit S [Desulfobacteraceae bacterium]